jgi:transaldolase
MLSLMRGGILTLNLNVKIFADGADLAAIKALYANPVIKGFTTNPTLMRSAGVKDYKEFALSVLEAIPDRPVSLEVFADDFDEMIEQGREIGSWGRNVNVKIPVVDSRGTFTGPVIQRLSASGIHVNVTAVFTLKQVQAVVDLLAPDVPAYVSVFAGRIADTGLDPVPIMAGAVEILKARPQAELIWASPRELLNIFHADSCGCQIITVTPDILKKLALVGKDQLQYSIETAQMFLTDAQKAGYSIPVPSTAPRRKASAAS